MPDRLLIVDGHSVIFRRPALARQHAENRMVAREALIRELTALQDAGECAVVVVFDGTGSRASDQTPPNGIRVFYSAAGQTADSLIERLVAKYAHTFDITVATDDHMEQTTVSSLGAAFISCGQLEDLIQEVGRGLQETLDKLARGHTPRRP